MLEAQTKKNSADILSMQNQLQTFFSIRVQLSKELGVVA
jgi:predicted nucleotidyltransferase